MKPYDNYEISPCRRYEEPDSPGKFYFEVCEPHEADVWTLYGHITGEGVQAIGDFSKREYAEETYQRITGIPFTGSHKAEARLRIMHTGPKLMEALEGVLVFFAEFEDDYREKLPCFESARAAIAQARGRAA
jgi:hypothetical protein